MPWPRPARPARPAGSCCPARRQPRLRQGAAGRSQPRPTGAAAARLAHLHSADPKLAGTRDVSTQQQLMASRRASKPALGLWGRCPGPLTRCCSVALPAASPSSCSSFLDSRLPHQASLPTCSGGARPSLGRGCQTHALQLGAGRTQGSSGSDGGSSGIIIIIIIIISSSGSGSRRGLPPGPAACRPAAAPPAGAAAPPAPAAPRCRGSPPAPPPAPPPCCRARGCCREAGPRRQRSSGDRLPSSSGGGDPCQLPPPLLGLVRRALLLGRRARCGAGVGH
jgi:hypothetical protein